MIKHILLLLFLSTSLLPLVAQTFSGQVVDERGAPIPYASLYVKELSSGFVTDDSGHFQTTLKVGNYTCEVASLGFIGQTLALSVSTAGVERRIVLAERIYELGEVHIVKGAEDPAYAVMRKAIAKASYHRTMVKGYTAGTYLKGTGKLKEIPALLKLSKEVRTETKPLLGKLFVLEEQQVITFAAPNTWNSEVKAYTNSFPENMQMNLRLTNASLYDAVIFEKVSPLSPRAFSFYRFKLEDCYQEGGHLVNKIKLLPKKESPKLLAGYLYIIEDLWCISAADITLNTTGMKATIQITCKEVKPSLFLPTSTSMRYTINIMGVKAEASYLAAVHYTKIEVATTPLAGSTTTVPGVVAPKRIASKHKFEKELSLRDEQITKDSLADKKDSTYWAAIRSVPLRQEELESYLRKEKQRSSNDTLPKKLRHKSDTLSWGSESVFNSLLEGKRFRSKDKTRWIRLYGISSALPEYNFVDGAWVGTKVDAGVQLSPTTHLQFTPSAYYATARKTIVGSAQLVLSYLPRRMGQLTMSGGVLSADYNGESGESRLINGLASLLFARNEVKLYDKRFLSIRNEVEVANGLLFASELAWQQRKALDNRVEQSLFGKRAEANVPRNAHFLPMEENDLLKASFALVYTPAHYYRMLRGKKVYEEARYPTFTLQYHRAFPLGGSTVSAAYHLIEFSARQEFEFGLFNRLLWNVNSGTYWRATQMQFPDYKHFAATRLHFTARTFDDGFFLLNNYQYSTATRWAQAGVTWHTPYLLLKQLPFLKQQSFDEALHLRSLAVYHRLPYTEIGYSVGFANLARAGIFAGIEALKHRSMGVTVSFSLSQLLGD